MATEDEGGAPLGPRFFEGRVLIELLSWDWALYVGLIPALGKADSPGLRERPSFDSMG